MIGDEDDDEDSDDDLPPNEPGFREEDVPMRASWEMQALPNHPVAPVVLRPAGLRPAASPALFARPDPGPLAFELPPAAPVVVRAPSPVVVDLRVGVPVPIEPERGHFVVRPDPRVAQLERQLGQAQSQVALLQGVAAESQEQMALVRRVADQRVAEQRAASFQVEMALQAAQNENARIVRQLAGFEEAQEDVLRMRAEVQFMREQQEELQRNMQAVHDERVGALMTLEEVRQSLAAERNARAEERRLLEAAVVEANARRDESRMVVAIRDQQLRDAMAEIYVLREDRNGDVNVRRLHEQEFRELQATLARIMQQYREMERRQNEGPIIEAVSDSSDDEPELQDRDASPPPPAVRSRIRFRYDRGPGFPDPPVDEPRPPPRAARRRAGPPPPEAEVIVIHGSSSEDEPEVPAVVPARAPTPGIPVVVLEEPPDEDLSDVDEHLPHVVRMFEGPGNRPVPRFFPRPAPVVEPFRRRGRGPRRAAREAAEFIHHIIQASK